MCNDDAGGPCRSIREPATCPLHSQPDLAVLISRELSPSVLGEMGFVCALRHRVPTVTIDPVRVADELWRIEPEMALARRHVELEDARVVREHVPNVGSVAVHRQKGHVAVEVRPLGQLTDPKARLSLADRTREAIRDHDPYVSVIDVSVAQGADDVDTHVKEA